MRKSLSFSFWSKRCSIRLHLRFAQRSSHIARRGVKLACKPQVQISSPQVNTSTLRQPQGLSVLFRRCGWCELHSAKQNGVRIPNEAVGKLVFQRRVQEYCPSGNTSTLRPASSSSTASGPPSPILGKACTPQRNI